jgi:hypothetical protein
MPGHAPSLRRRPHVPTPLASNPQPAAAARPAGSNRRTLIWRLKRLSVRARAPSRHRNARAQHEHLAAAHAAGAEPEPAGGLFVDKALAFDGLREEGVRHFTEEVATPRMTKLALVGVGQPASECRHHLVIDVVPAEPAQRLDDGAADTACGCHLARRGVLQDDLLSAQAAPDVTGRRSGT